MRFAGNQIQGSPFTVDVFDVNKVYVDVLGFSTVREEAKVVGKDIFLKLKLRLKFCLFLN